MSIGLKRGAVRLESHHQAWADLFEQEKALLVATLETHRIDVEHVGSTAIPGIEAKPILDILLGLPDLTHEFAIRPHLESLGYLYRGEQGVPGRILYVKGDEANRTHHLHVATYKSQFWLEQLCFRDTLRLQPHLAQAYNDLKHTLAAQYADDRAAYTAGKHAFIETVLQKCRPDVC